VQGGGTACGFQDGGVGGQGVAAGRQGACRAAGQDQQADRLLDTAQGHGLAGPAVEAAGLGVDAQGGGGEVAVGYVVGQQPGQVGVAEDTVGVDRRRGGGGMRMGKRSGGNHGGLSSLAPRRGRG